MWWGRAAMALAVAGAARAAPPPTAAAQGDPAAALARLRAEEAGPRRPSREETARRLDAIAMEYLAGNDAPRAIELLSEAVARDPDNGVALADLTLAYVKNGDIEFAEFYLRLARQSVHRVNPDPRIYVALGNVYEAQNRTDDAIVAWEEAIRLGARSPELEHRLEKARTEWAYAHGQNFLAGENFEFFSDPGIASEEVEAIQKFLDASVPVLSDFFLERLRSRVIVILYRGRRFFSLMDTPDWVAGVFDGKIRIPVDSQGVASTALQGLLLHELAHAFLFESSRGRAPAWLQEGLAQFVQGKRILAEELRPWGDRAKLHTFAGLDELFQRHEDREEARMAYQVALSVVEYLIRRAGSGSLVCLAQEIGAGADEAAAFRDTFAETPDDVLADWRADTWPARSPRVRD
jgi:tetratricopeptide (TPR) repeat protein